MRKDLIVVSKMNLGFWLVVMSDSRLVSSCRICAILMTGSLLVAKAVLNGINYGLFVWYRSWSWW